MCVYPEEVAMDLIWLAAAMAFFVACGGFVFLADALRGEV